MLDSLVRTEITGLPATVATAGLHHIVIVGGGAGGLELATRLGDKLGKKRKARVTLIDRSRTHIWKPLLHEIAAGSLNVCRSELDYLAQGHWHGFQFRYGRSGRHPFQSWDGQLPGTLPMASGVGEAPCQVLSYESDGLPRQYLGNLLVASWADHRVECYELKERGASGASRMDRAP